MLITGSPPLDHWSGYDPVFNELVSESSGFRRQDWLWVRAEGEMMSLRSSARLALRKGRIKPNA
jgi:hypothetical protein